MRLIVIKQGIVENLVAVTPETEVTAKVFLEDQGFVIVGSDAPVSIGWTYDESTGEFQEAVAADTTTWDISKNAFKKRFPRAKWNAASMASTSNSLLYDFFETYREVPYVTLTDPETYYAVMALSMDNIPEEMRLTGDEVDAVLSVPARSDELP